MATKTVLGGIAVSALVGGTLVAGAPAHADDYKVRTGDCSRTATYRMVLGEVDRDDRDRLRAVFTVNGPRANARWSLTFKRNGQVVSRTAKRANDRGNVTVARSFRGDDDAWVKVIARSAYGERCARAISADD